MLLQLEIEIGVGEAAGAPVLAGDDLTRGRYELGAEFAAPGAEFETPASPCGALDRRDVFPRRIVAGTESVMHGIENPELRLARRMQNLLHMRNTVIRFRYGLDPRPDLATLGNEVVVGVDNQ